MQPETLARVSLASATLHLTPRNVVREALESQAKKRGLSSEVLEVALWAAAKAGTPALKSDDADALLDLAIGFDRAAQLLLSPR